jgi:hypothetical protein
MKSHIARMAAAAGLSAVAFVASVQAHHSLGMFDVSAPIWVKGTVLRYEPISPHAMIELEERTADGRIQRWSVEGPFPGRLQRILSFNNMSAEQRLVKPDDVIEVCGFDLRADLRARGVSTEPNAASAKFMHGHVIVMPDGHMQSWGPYGKMNNCVRPTDRAKTWGDFLNTEPLARDLWCNGRSNTKVASIAPKALVDEVDSLITNRCK